MSRATMSLPFRLSRVFTGYLASVARISFIGRSRSTRDRLALLQELRIGEKPRGVGVELFEKDAVVRDLRVRLPVGAAAHADPHGERRPVPREPDDADVVREVLSAELRAESERVRPFHHLGLERGIPERAPRHAPLCRKPVVIVRGGDLERLHRHLGGCPADDHGEVVRGTRRRPQRPELFADILGEPLRG